MTQNHSKAIILTLCLLTLGSCLCTILVGVSPFITTITLSNGMAAPPGMGFLSAFVLLIFTILAAATTVGAFVVLIYLPNRKHLQDKNAAHFQELLFQTALSNIQLQLSQNPMEDMAHIWNYTRDILPSLNDIQKGKLIRFLCNAISHAVIDLSDADLTNIDLVGVNLSNTNLSGANLSGANLDQANLIKSRITVKQLQKAKSYNDAILPANLYIEKGGS